MKSLSKHIQESLNKKFEKEVSNEKPVEEDLSNLMRTSPAKSILTRGTTRDEENKK